MPKPGFITRHRNLLMIALLAATLAVSSEANRRRLQETRQTIAMPVIQTESAITTYKEERDSSYLSDIDALQSVSADASLDSATREAAAARLTQLVADREASSAIEAALNLSALSPCTAVVSGGSVTIVTEKADISKEDTALALTIALAHTDADPGNVRIIPAAQ